MRTTKRSFRRRIGAVIVASIIFGIAAPTSAQEPPPDDGTLTPVPDEQGEVHSWALAPGDGTREAGERPNLSYDLPPGGEVQDIVTLFNYSNVTLNFRIYATDAFNTDDGSFSLLPAEDEPTGVGSWVTVSSESVTIPPQTQLTFPITVKVPPDARPGDHVGALLASSQAQGTGPDGTIVNLDRRTGSRIYVRVAGPLSPELAVEDLSTSYSPSLNPLGGTAEVRYTIVNRGNVRLGARHEVSFGGPFGLMRETVAGDDVVELLPGESIEVTRTLDNVAATVVAFTEVELEPLGVDGAAEDGLEPTSRRAFGFAIPLTVIAALVVLGLAAYARHSYARHRRDDIVIVERRAT